MGGHTDPSSGILSERGVGVGPPSHVSSKGGVVGGRKAFEGPLARNVRGRLHLMLQAREGLWLCQGIWTCHCVESQTSCLSVKLGSDVLWAYLAPSHFCLPQ